MITRTLTVLTTLLSAAAFAYAAPPIDDPSALKDVRVAPISGAVVLTRCDLETPQGTWSLRRTYAPGLGQLHNFGPNWVSLLDARVHVLSPQKVLVLDANGSPRVFVARDTGGFAAESGLPATLSVTAAGMLLSEAGSQQGFDADGRLVLWTRERGTLRITRNGAGIATRIETPEDEVVLLREGKVLTGVRNGERSVSYQRDEAGNVIAAKRPGSSETYAYDELGRLSKVGGERVELSYDDQNRVIQLTRAGAPDVSYAYEGERTQTRTIAGETVTLVLSEDERRLVERGERDALTTEFDARHRPVALFRGEQRVQTLGYDEQGRLVKLGATALRYLDADTLPDVTVTPDGVTRYRYDALGRVVSRQRAGQELAIRYDGPTTHMQAPSGVKVTRTRELTRSRVVHTSPSGTVLRERVYDALGRTVEQRELGKAPRFFNYGADGRLTEVYGPKGLIARFGFDAEGQPQRVEDALGNASTCAYDDGARVLTDAASGERVQRFDDAGRLVSEVAGGVETRYVYDDAGRLVRRVSGTASERFRYDAQGRLRSMSGPDGGLSYTYDEQGRLQQVTHEPLGQSVEYRYDAKGRRAAVVLPWGTISYERDASGRLAAVESPQGRVELEHNAQGQRTVVRYPNGVETRFAYAEGRLESIETRRGEEVLVRQAYRYTRSGRIAEIAGLGDEATEVDFDLEGRLTRAGEVQFAYDAAGNRVRVVDGEGETRSTYGAGNRLLTAGETGFVYDAQGRLIQRGEGEDLQAFDYDARGRLTAVHAADGATVRYGYAPNGQLLWREDAAGRTSFLSGIEGTYAEVAHGAVQQAFVLGEGIDDVLAVERDKEAFFFHTDRVRSVLAMTGPEGEVAARYRYGAFGEQLEQSGPAAEWNRLGFTSRPHDATSGLVDMRARPYSPELGRFLTPDPLAHQGGMNLYAYVGNNPLRYRDPLGLDDDDPFPNPFKDLGEITIGIGVGIVTGIADAAEDAYHDAREWTENAYDDAREWTEDAYHDAREWTENAYHDARDWAINNYNDAADWSQAQWDAFADWTTNTAWPWVRDDGIPTAVGVGVFLAGMSNPITAPYAWAWLDGELGISRSISQFFDRELGFRADAFADWFESLDEAARAELLETLNGVAADGYSSVQLPHRDFADLEAMANALEVLRVIEHVNDAIARGTVEKALVAELNRLAGQLKLPDSQALIPELIAAYEKEVTKADPSWYPGKTPGNYSTPDTISETVYDMPALVSLLRSKATSIGAIPAQDMRYRSDVNGNAFQSRFPGLGDAAAATQ